MADLLELQGKLRLRASERARWLRSPARPTESDRYSEAGFGKFDPNKLPRHHSVQHLLDALQRDSQIRAKITYARSPVVVAGLVPDRMVAYYWPLLVGAFEQAAPVGGHGELRLTLRRTHAMRVRIENAAAILECANLKTESAKATGPIRLPGIIESAKSGRSSCRACKAPIPAGTPRFGVADLDRGLPEKPTYRWYHLPCAAKVLPHSLGPVLRQTAVPIADRKEVWESLPPGAQTAPAIAVFSRGQRVRTPDGRIGHVVWYGKNKYGPGIRVGVDLGDDVRVWKTPDELEAER